MGAQEPGYDLVTCLVCGRQAKSLARHLKAVHGITADQYRSRYPNAKVRSKTVTAKMSQAAKARRGGHGKGDTKTVRCPECGVGQTKSKFLVPGVHDLRCPGCKQRHEDGKWAGKTEPQDYVACLECGYRAENLTSHVQNTHPGYRERHPGTFLVAFGSVIRDKARFRGVQRPPGFGQRIREAKLLDLGAPDFAPYMEPDGTIDHHAMMKATGHAWLTLKTYMKGMGLAPTPKYRDQAFAEHQVVLTAEQLEPFKLGNGKVSIAKAMTGLGYCNVTVKRECLRLGLKWAHGNVLQHRCLVALSEALGGLPFREEWQDERFVNPGTGRQYRFDGYFPGIGLVVEVHGYQHYTFPNHFMPQESYRPLWEALVERDRVKRNMILGAPGLMYLEVLEDEPYADVAYLTGRLAQLGAPT